MQTYEPVLLSSAPDGLARSSRRKSALPLRRVGICLSLVPVSTMYRLSVVSIWARRYGIHLSVYLCAIVHKEVTSRLHIPLIAGLTHVVPICDQNCFFQLSWVGNRFPD